MPATERLYYNDSHLIEFEARVVDVTERVSGWTAVVLDRTAFYPTGGGQPSDTGTLDGSRVVECMDDGAGGVLHVMQGMAPARNAVVAGRVDWARRLDHIQQHTGQHILSQAFVTLFNAPTKSFRVLEAVCEIDVELSNPTSEMIERAVELANNIVWEDRLITIHNVSAEQAAAMPLRKESSREGELRLIEIEGFDLTPCGGTHAYRTGEVGMIAMRSWERAKGLTRIEFVAGMRALADYRKANRAARDAAALFSTGRDDVSQVAAQLVEENKELHRQVRALEEIAAEVEAQQLLASASQGGGSASAVLSTSGSQGASGSASEGVGSESQALSTSGSRGASGSASERLGSESKPLGSSEGLSSAAKGLSGSESQAVAASGAERIVTQIFDGRDAESLKKLAHALMAHPHTIALLGSRDNNTARLVFARSADARGDMSALMRDACALLDGRGGGKPEMAQGGGKNVAKLEEAINGARNSLVALDTA